MDKLKPCPFCGSEIPNYEIRYEGNRPAELTVNCSCGARITTEADWLWLVEHDSDVDCIPPEKDAISAWNRRAEAVLDSEATNADRIRAMSDEEMAIFLRRFHYPWCAATCVRAISSSSFEDCDTCALTWLQSPADGGDEA